MGEQIHHDLSGVGGQDARYAREREMSKACRTGREEILARIERSFTYHSPRPDQQERYIALRTAAKSLALMIVAFTPEGRDQAVAITKLEESIMWANKAIAVNE